MKDNQKEAILHNLIYFAGLIDGEGCFRMSANRGRGQYHCHFSIGMVERHIIEQLKEVFKLDNKISVECIPGRKPVYRLQCSNKDKLREMIDMLLPYLRIKDKQCYAMLGYWEARTVRSVNGAATLLTDEELQLREEFYRLVKKLNATGAPATTNRENVREGEVIV